MARRGIPTTYKGIEYRSRLEARWAAMFDQLGWQHTYEPFDGNGYIPDFLIHGKHPLLVEVKPASTRRDYLDAVAKIRSGLSGRWDGAILIAGVSPIVAPAEMRAAEYPFYGWDNAPKHMPRCPDCGDPSYPLFAGWVGYPGPSEVGGGWVYGAASLYNFRTGTEGPRDRFGLWEHIGGGHHPNCPEDRGSYVHETEIEALWAKATNAVKWMAPTRNGGGSGPDSLAEILKSLAEPGPRRN